MLAHRFTSLRFQSSPRRGSRGNSALGNLAVGRYSLGRYSLGLLTLASALSLAGCGGDSGDMAGGSDDLAASGTGTGTDSSGISEPDSFNGATDSSSSSNGDTGSGTTGTTTTTTTADGTTTSTSMTGTTVATDTAGTTTTTGSGGAATSTQGESASVGGFANAGADPSDSTSAEPAANTNVALGGSQDIGLFRAKLAAGDVPFPGDLDAAGFFAEHHTELPPPACGERVCLQPMLAVMSNLIDGSNCTMLQLGLNSPIAADPGNRPPLSLAVVVDTSGSMATAGKIDFVRDGLAMLIDGLNDEDQLSIITYSTDVQIAVPMTEVQGNRADMRDVVESLVASGSTNIYDGLETGYSEMLSNYDSARQNRVIFLSDGQATIGITDNDSISDMSEAYNSDGIGLTTVGLGTDFNVELMRDLALRADGNYYFLENAGAVSEVFREELSFFTVPIAFDLKIDLHAGSDYDFGRAVGSPFWEDTDDGGGLEVPSVFIAHRESAADITDEGGRRGGGSALLIELMPKVDEDDGSGQEEAEVAVIDVEFREPGASETVKDTVVVNYPRAPWILERGGFFDGTDINVIQKSFVMLNIFVGLERAVTEFHAATDASEAIGDLERLLAAVMDYNEEIEDVDMEYDIELMEDLRDVMLENGTPEPEIIDIDEDPWPAD